MPPRLVLSWTASLFLDRVNAVLADGDLDFLLPLDSQRPLFAPDLTLDGVGHLLPIPIGELFAQAIEDLAPVHIAFAHAGHDMRDDSRPLKCRGPLAAEGFLFALAICFVVPCWQASWPWPR